MWGPQEAAEPSKSWPWVTGMVGDQESQRFRSPRKDGSIKVAELGVHAGQAGGPLGL